MITVENNELFTAIYALFTVPKVVIISSLQICKARKIVFVNNDYFNSDGEKHINSRQLLFVD